MADNAKKLNFNVKDIPVSFVVLGVVLAYIIVAIVLSIVKFSIPVVTVGAFVVLEGVLAALLNKIPVWVHGLFFIGMIVAGVCFHHVAFMVMMAFVYVACVALLYAWTRDDK